MKFCQIVKISIHIILTLLENDQIWPRGYKISFMLNSAELEIVNAHKYKNIKRFGNFLV